MPDQPEQDPLSTTQERVAARKIVLKSSGFFLLAFAWIGFEALRHFFFRSQTASLVAPPIRPGEPAIKIPVRGDAGSLIEGSRPQTRHTITIALPTQSDILPLLLPAGMAALLVIFIWLCTALASLRFTDDGAQIAPTVYWMLAVLVGMGVLLWVSVKMPRLAPLALTPEVSEARTAWIVRSVAATLALGLSVNAYISNANMTFTQFGVMCWVTSVIFWVIAFYPTPQRPIARLRAVFGRLVGKPILAIPLRLNVTWLLIAMLVTIAVVIWFCFHDLSRYAPDMNLDHVLTLGDVRYNIGEGNTPSFLPTGSAEPFQQYFLYGLHLAFGLDYNFDLLKLSTGVAAVLIVILSFWMGRTLVGEEDRTLGVLAGLFMGLMTASSFWVTILARDGLRALWGAPAAELVFILLLRGIRHNRRRDFVLAGLALGIALWTYTTSRALPFVVIAGFVIAVLWRSRSRRELIDYARNFGVTLVLGTALLVPQIRVAVDDPSVYWGRFLALQGIDPNSTNAQHLGVQGLLDTLASHATAIVQNTRDVFLMLFYKGDWRAFYGTTDRAPVLDPVTSALFLLGIVLVLVRIVKRRDPVDVMLPIIFAIMLLPSVLGVRSDMLADDGVSSYRILGNISIVYFVAALLLATLVQSLRRAMPGRVGNYVFIGSAFGLLAYGGSINYVNYFTKTRTYAWTIDWPHQEMGRIARQFSETVGGPANEFVVYRAGWIDPRGVQFEAGQVTQIYSFNPPITPDYLYSRLDEYFNDGSYPYKFDPTRDVLFFVKADDQESMDGLRKTFPVLTADKPTEDLARLEYWVVSIPAPGCDWAKAHLHSPLPACSTSTPTPTVTEQPDS